VAYYLKKVTFYKSSSDSQFLSFFDITKILSMPGFLFFFVIAYYPFSVLDLFFYRVHIKNLNPLFSSLTRNIL